MTEKENATEAKPLFAYTIKINTQNQEKGPKCHISLGSHALCKRGGGSLGDEIGLSWINMGLNIGSLCKSCAKKAIIHFENTTAHD